MTGATNLNIRIDRNLKKQADDILGRMGMNLSTAVNVFVRQVVRERAIPFKISLSEDESAVRKAKKALRDMQEQSALNGLSEMTVEQIDAEIAAYRKEKGA